MFTTEEISNRLRRIADRNEALSLTETEMLYEAADRLKKLEKQKFPSIFTPEEKEGSVEDETH